MTPLRRGQGELRWAGNRQLPKQPMHSSGSAGASSGWHLDPTLQTKWRFEHPNGLSWLQQASWFHMDSVPAPCYLRRATEQHTFLFHIPVAYKKPIKHSVFSHKMSGQHEVMSRINPGRAHQDRDLNC